MKKLGVLLLLASLASGCSMASGQTPGQTAPQPSIGGSQIEVVGDYVGKRLKLTVDGVVLAEGRQHLLPPGMSWKLTVAPGPARSLPARMEIDDCPVWTNEISVAPAAITTLIVRGCSIEALQPG